MCNHACARSNALPLKCAPAQVRSVQAHATTGLPLSAMAARRSFRTFAKKNSPALYDERTSGPLAVYRKPSASARVRHMSNFSGLTYSFTWR